MNKIPFLYRFRTKSKDTETDELFFSIDRQVNVTKDEMVVWSARSRRYPTSCYTKGRTIKAGYTRSGKWKPSKYRPGRTDRRAGK